MIEKVYFEPLKKELKNYLHNDSIKNIEEAYSFAFQAHKGQYRCSKDPYICHPVEVAAILAKLQQDPDSITAALLHDTLEDTAVTYEQISEKFGENIALLVDGVTKLGKIKFFSKKEELAENFRKMFIAMAKDLRVIIIKLADRLHNMRTLQYLPESRRRKFSEETRDIFSPLAHRLGMWTLKWELEDLVFYHLQYNEFQKIKKLIMDTRKDREFYVENFLSAIDDILKKADVKAKLYGRPKHFHSIHLKLLKQNIPFEELYDTLGIRIILASVKDCYEALGIVHSVFKPISGRIKDYIAMPKSNGYQSLHTTVIGPAGRPIEVQIRTEDMHQTAELGIAAHWRYKEGTTAEKNSDVDFVWLRQIIDLQKEKNAPEDFLRNLKMDLFVDEVFVFTPKGDVYSLQKGSTPLDFAYRIHSEVGHRCIGAKVNNHIVSLNYQLKSGDRIEVLTSNKLNPKVNWLDFVKTSHARSKIKQWIRKQRAAENIQKGKLLLEKTLIVSSYPAKEVLTSENLKRLSQHYKIKTYDDLYLLIGYGEVSAKEVVHYFDKYLKKEVPEVKEEEVLKKYVNQKPKKAMTGGIKVLGEHNVMVRMAKCCNPLPGDGVAGFVTFGAGVSIHRSNCIHILNLSDKDKARIVEVAWDTGSAKQKFIAALEIEAFDRLALLHDIIEKITETKTNVKGIQTKKLSDKSIAKICLSVEIRDTRHLQQVTNAIGQLADVYSVKRLIR
ncbi:MAG: bifunctional (p)ppGpp synthetase/guanosine-3',5'-bis(diphosphate) 3'-pyrophosphohydrolase [bacterium]|nr:bifunctional (p)ppGpp synthetase/guanosine-3',5'-bis(diphosphate) 3'-pyrophosphohydrolase [bacterium]